MSSTGLEGRVVLVTGAWGNLGTAAVEAFAAEGARLVLVDRSEGELPDAVAQLDESRYLAITGIDLTDADAIATMVDQVVDQFAGVDVLVNTVGGYRAGRPVHETDVDTWKFMLELNATTAFLLSRALAPVMLKAEFGRLIHVSSGSGLHSGPGEVAYSAAKSAVIRLTEALAADYKGRGINANCILPSIIDTPQNREAMPKADFGKWVRPESLAEVIVFLASDAARDVTGVALPVRGKV